jgi:hypothetical protein
VLGRGPAGPEAVRLGFLVSDEFFARSLSK